MSKCISSNNTLHLNNHKFYVRDAYFDLIRMQPNKNQAIAPLRALRGYSYRVHPAMGNILLNVSPANSAFWRPLLVSEIYEHGSGPFGNSKNGVKRALRGVRVYINYKREMKDKKCKHPNCKDPTRCSSAVVPGIGGTLPISRMDDQHARIKTIRDFGDPCNVQKFVWEHKDAHGTIIAGPRVAPTVQEYQRDRKLKLLPIFQTLTAWGRVRTSVTIACSTCSQCRYSR